MWINYPENASWGEGYMQVHGLGIFENCQNRSVLRPLLELRKSTSATSDDFSKLPQAYTFASPLMYQCMAQ